MNDNTGCLRALCVGRHEFLAEHLARFFSAFELETRPAVGLQQAQLLAREFHPEVIICEYELLAILTVEAWEQEEFLHCPIIAVSLTRRPQEAHLVALSGIDEVLYLPSLDPEATMRRITAAVAAVKSKYVPTPPATSPSTALKS